MCDKAPDELARFLAEGSFKESANIWTRNNGFLAFHAITFGFAANLVKSQIFDIGISTALAVIGLILSVLHYRILKISEYYNLAWYSTLEDWIIKNDRENQKYWNQLKILIDKHDPKNIPYQKHSTDIAKAIPYLTGIAWIGFAGYIFYLAFKA